MKKFKIMRMLKEFEVPESVICDICKKEFTYEKDEMEIQEFVHIRYIGGYGAVFGDGNLVELDICQHCLKEQFNQFVRINNGVDCNE